MLLSGTSQQDNQGTSSALPKGFPIKQLPNFAAEFFSGAHHGRRRQMRLLELPDDLAPPLCGELPSGAAHHNESRITETGQRAEKLRHFAQDCSWAWDHVYFGGEGVAQDRGRLDANCITHVVNCVRLEVQNYFYPELYYKELYLQDSGVEDILAVLYDVFDFIEEAKKKNGNVFVHCSQGVSRSAALVIAYVMWRKDQSFERTKEELKGRRGVVDPNVNFCTQLISWGGRFHVTSDGFLRIYRMGTHSYHQPNYIVPRQLLRTQHARARPPASIVFDPRGTFVIHGPQKVFIWIGSRHVRPYLDGARKFARQLSKYERAPVAKEIYEESEPTEFFDLLAEVLHTRSVLVIEQEDFTSDYERFSQNLRASSSMKESSRSNGTRPTFRRTFSET